MFDLEAKIPGWGDEEDDESSKKATKTVDASASSETAKEIATAEAEAEVAATVTAEVKQTGEASAIADEAEAVRREKRVENRLAKAGEAAASNTWKC